MDTARIPELLQPYLASHELTPLQLNQISSYIDLLQKWNERTNLTAIREPEQMLRRHFGESLFAAIHLLDSASTKSVIDVGSGAGFPGLPCKIFAPDIRLTLIESQNKKNTFLREVIRALQLPNVEVFLGRAENFQKKAEIVTMRAVEHFREVLPVSNALVEPMGQLAILVGAAQVAVAKEAVPGAWSEPVAVPNSTDRVLITRRAE